MTDAKRLVQEFLKLQKAYSFTKRALITSDRYVQIAKAGMVDVKDYENEVLHEPLIEHIGHLPILASFLYPHIEHTQSVDLGRSLIMLSIHDIGETVTGEIFAYHKTNSDSQTEYQAALEVLHPDMHSYFEEYEANETLDAKYARAIDALAPNIHEVDMPNVTMERFTRLNASVSDVIKKKKKYVEWDIVLLEIFDLLMTQYNRINNGDRPVFKPEPYDIKL